jgi:dolichol-phosphate mannosyltransferase
VPDEVPDDALPTLSVVIPTRNESGNIEPLVRRLSEALDGVVGGWELLFVDDSDDMTPDAVERLASGTDQRITLLHRGPGQRDGGLGGAVKLGFSKASGRVIVVMDADLQHPPEILPALVSPVLSGRCDLAVGNRYGFMGGRDGLAGPLRHVIALSCRWLAHGLVPTSRAISDPMSGLFAIERSVVDRAQLQPEGYKILLEVVARGDWHSASNVDYRFDERYSGQSKARLREGLVFLRHLWHLSLVGPSKDRELPNASLGEPANEGPR